LEIRKTLTGSPVAARGALAGVAHIALSFHQPVRRKSA